MAFSHAKLIFMQSLDIYVGQYKNLPSIKYVFHAKLVYFLQSYQKRQAFAHESKS